MQPASRPYRAQSATGPERVTFTIEGQQTWRQVGWHGQTGAFYSLDEDPSPTEPGSFSPLWLLIEDKPPVLDIDS
jgi:hypothetical protein